ncbi:hypothetical protein Tco_0816057, partial [Tanacetum coccineum]
YTWTLFLRSKDETPEVLKDFRTMIQRNLQAPVISVRTDRGTEFLNKTLKSVPKTNESEGLSKPVTLQNLPKTAMQAVRNTNVIKPGMYRIVSSTTQTRAPQLNRTFRNTNVSRPQPRSNQMKDKVVPYTSHAKLKKWYVLNYTYLLPLKTS